MTPERIGLIGLGRMGRRLAARLLTAGYSLSVFDVDASKVRAIDGARGTGSPAEVAADASVIITMVTDGPALLDALSKALPCATAGALLIDMSTIGVVDSARVAEACANVGVDYVRSPVLGTLPSAESGELTALVSGPPAAVERSMAILKHLSSRQHYCGPDEQARTAKLIVNGLLASSLASFCEGFVVGEKAGLDRDLLLEIMGNSSMASPALKGTAQALRASNFDPRLTVALLLKDLRLLSEAAGRVGAPVPLASAALPLYQATASMGWADQDTSAVLLLLETLSGINRHGG